MSEAPKRFWLFAGDEHYATGGVHDRRGMYGTIAEAVAEGKRQQTSEWSDRLFAVYEWWHVVDITTGEIVAGSELQAYGAPDLTPEQIEGAPWPNRRYSGSSTVIIRKRSAMSGHTGGR